MSSCTCDFGRGTRTCHCAGCHATFTGLESFDRHQHMTDTGVVCLDPAEMKTLKGGQLMAIYRTTPDGRPVWGRYRPDLPGRGSHVHEDDGDQVPAR